MQVLINTFVYDKEVYKIAIKRWRIVFVVISTMSCEADPRPASRSYSRASSSGNVQTSCRGKEEGPPAFVLVALLLCNENVSLNIQ